MHEENGHLGAERFILLSGCSGGGKSTLLGALKRRGFTVFEEPGRQIVREQHLIDGPGLPWCDAPLFAELCVSRAMQQLGAASSSEGMVFFDRGVIDAVAFFEYVGQAVPAHIERAAWQCRYHSSVFLTPPWQEIFVGDSERKHSFEDAVLQFEASLSTFARLGYRTIELPKADLERRVAFVLSQVAQPQASCSK
ncbi:AAA family ATPase [Rhizobium sp. ARZ01]|uniref:AAA family ATPase n=1 Tax=Rhizobium sp. ARZ01 TaxID=2769313 RepID=UPI001781CC7F|nr:AAA family ATPase [Rhizobium sp. ARZ01]MBD9374346.1 AAA family ATPase [Rhizobium sp. ARZ01]